MVFAYQNGPVFALDCGAMVEGFTALAEHIFVPGDPPAWVKYLLAARLVKGGASLDHVAKSHALNRAKLNRVASATDPLLQVLGITPAGVSEEVHKRAVKQLGQMLLGVSGERAFISNYEGKLASEGLQLTDIREGRTSTDYRVSMGDLPWCKLNIKFHGTRFLKAKDLVQLEPEDSFALATYKIWGAIQAQQADGIPYVFAIVGVPEISAQAIGEAIPQSLTDAAALILGANKHGVGKHDFEDALVRHIADTGTPPFPDIYRQIAGASWYMVSGAKAMRLMKEHLFQRVYALRVKRFTRNYPTAEVDMHFSLSKDLLPFDAFLQLLREEDTETMQHHLAEGVY